MEGLPVRNQPMGGGNLQARALQEEGEEGEKPEEKFKTLNIWTFLEKTQQHQKKNNRNIKQGREGTGRTGKKEHQNIYDEKRQCQNKNKIKR